MTIDVKLEKFEGPLQLLLELIEKNKLEVAEISLAAVTDQYLAYLRDSLEEIPKEQIADFLVIASRLLLIKSRAILPALELTSEEEAGIRDLESALKELARYRRAAKALRHALLTPKPLYCRPLLAGVSLGFMPPRNITPAVLRGAFESAILSLESYFQKFEEKVIERIESIEDRISEVIRAIEGRVELHFRELLRKKEKSEIVLTFLALLFLFKEQVIKLLQRAPFEEIVVSNPASLRKREGNSTEV